MNEYGDKALLPDGLHDDLPPDAEFEARVIERLLAAFAAYGYERVKPPLVEFEQSLLAGPGGGMAAQTFRLMDPVSQRMMGVRADITPQIARIASTRLGRTPRPLRLSYAGQVLRVKGSQLRPERQFAQAGAELVGAPALTAEAEIVGLAAESLGALGVAELSFDFYTPTLVPQVCAAFELDQEAASRLRHALDGKDAAVVRDIPGPLGEVLAAILDAAGPAARAVEVLAALDLPEGAGSLRDDLCRLVEMVRAAAPELGLTVDAGEFRGFEYQDGISFTLFAKGVRGELGRGGRYRLDGGETAVGFTVYLDTLLRALPERARTPRVYLPYATDPGRGKQLRAEGWRTLDGLEAEDDAEAEARRLGCTHLLAEGQVRELG
jgi:ATP phosphoribosyltransferase regulatory subunit